MGQYQDVLFWVFLGFFAVIGVLSFLAILGIGHLDPGFRKWAVTGFVTGVAGAVFGLFKVVFSGVVLVVTLVPAADIPPGTLDLKRGTYYYDELTSAGEVKPHRGPIEVGRAEASANWQVRLPPAVLDRAVRLEFENQDGATFIVQPFYPSHTTREMVKGAKSSAPPTSRRQGLVAVAQADTPGAGSSGGPRLVAAEASREIKFQNYARPAGQIQGRDYYQWRVFVDEPPAVLDQIAEVQYVLHPTFPQPYQVSRDRGRQFELVQSGWGGFTMLITVRFRDGTETKTSYFLKLANPWPEGR
jgi:hypothetical protein